MKKYKTRKVIEVKPQEAKKQKHHEKYNSPPTSLEGFFSNLLLELMQNPKIHRTMKAQLIKEYNLIQNDKRAFEKIFNRNEINMALHDGIIGLFSCYGKNEDAPTLSFIMKH